ncbi:MAG: hypothetical protein ABRQ27_08405 [Clostridiaceae bacterium]
MRIYGVTFLYNLDPEQSKARDEFLESDRFNLAVNKEYIILTDKKTRETFKIKGDDYNKLILDMKISIE